LGCSLLSGLYLNKPIVIDSNGELTGSDAANLAAGMFVNFGGRNDQPGLLERVHSVRTFKIEFNNEQNLRFSTYGASSPDNELFHKDGDISCVNGSAVYEYTVSGASETPSYSKTKMQLWKLSDSSLVINVQRSTLVGYFFMSKSASSIWYKYSVTDSQGVSDK
jgi:hypothetical protein